MPTVKLMYTLLIMLIVIIIIFAISTIFKDIIFRYAGDLFDYKQPVIQPADSGADVTCSYTIDESQKLAKFTYNFKINDAKHDFVTDEKNIFPVIFFGDRARSPVKAKQGTIITERDKGRIQGVEFDKIEFANPYENGIDISLFALATIGFFKNDFRCMSIGQEEIAPSKTNFINSCASLSLGSMQIKAVIPICRFAGFEAVSCKFITSSGICTMTKNCYWVTKSLDKGSVCFSCPIVSEQNKASCDLGSDQCKCGNNCYINQKDENKCSQCPANIKCEELTPQDCLRNACGRRCKIDTAGCVNI